MSESETVVLTRAEAENQAKARHLLERLLNHPEAGTASLEDLVVKVNPTAKLTVKEAREALLAPMEARFKAEADKREALEKRWEERETREKAEADKALENQFVERLAKIKNKYGFSDEMSEKVTARMREQNNPDVEAAAAWVAETLPRPAPAVGHDFLPSTLDPFGSATGDKAWEGLHKSPDQWQTAELRAIVRDPEFLALGNT